VLLKLVLAVVSFSLLIWSTTTAFTQFLLK
jgi:hypothetical protein